jgi:hypothetical protein
MAQSTILSLQTVRANRRETILWIGAAAVILTTLAVIAMLGLYTYPVEPYIDIGMVGDFPSGGPPQLVNVEGTKFYVVSIDHEIIVFDPRTPHFATGRCQIKWAEAIGRFEDPCGGSKFHRDGSWDVGPAPRDLDRYQVKIGDDGTVWVLSLRTIMGDPHP